MYQKHFILILGLGHELIDYIVTNSRNFGIPTISFQLKLYSEKRNKQS